MGVIESIANEEFAIDSYKLFDERVFKIIYSIIFNFLYYIRFISVFLVFFAAVGVVWSSGHSNAACKSSRSALLLLEYREVAYCWGSPSYSSSFNFSFSDQLICDASE